MKISINEGDRKCVRLEVDSNSNLVCFDVNIERVVTAGEYGFVLFEDYSPDEPFFTNVIAINQSGRTVWQVPEIKYQRFGYSNVVVEGGKVLLSNFGGYWMVYEIGTWDFIEQIESR